MKNINPNKEVTLYILEGKKSYPIYDEYELHKLHYDIDKLKKDAKEYVDEYIQGGDYIAIIHSISFIPNELLQELKGNYEIEVNDYDDLIYTIRKLGIDIDTDLGYYYNSITINHEIETFINEHKSIEDKLIVRYYHEKYMNYAHVLTDFRFGLCGETTKDLSQNPDHTYKSWDCVLNLKKEDLIYLPVDEIVDLIAHEIQHLKYGGFNRPSIKKILEESNILNILI